MDMTYSRGWLIAFFIFIANSNKVTGYLLRNPKSSSDDVNQHETTFTHQFNNHEGGIIDSPSGFLCLNIVEVNELNYSDDEDSMVRFSCRYEKEGVIMSSTLGDIDGIFNENFQDNGKLFLKGATYEESTNTIQITPEVEFIWLSTEDSQTKMKVVPRGSKTVLVFHVTSNGKATAGSPAQLSDWVFGTSGDLVNLKSQYEACSFNQLMFTPATGANIVDGVVEAIINPLNNDFETMSNAAMQYAFQLGIPVKSFDHLMFALPITATDNGHPMTAGIADEPGKLSWYPSGDIRIVSLTMHEIGHNLGLKHSGEGVQRYGDKTCMMGIGDGESDLRMCFNAAKMKQLAWYTNRERTIDPSRETFSGKIIGVNDYQSSNSGHVLVLEIINSAGSSNLYVTYNKAEGITAGTLEYKNQIVVVSATINPKLESGTYSDLVQHVKVGASATIPNFGDGGSLTISFVNTGSDGNVDYANVKVTLTNTVYAVSG